jgi:Signal transduction histidine kinase
VPTGVRPTRGGPPVALPRSQRIEVSQAGAKPFIPLALLLGIMTVLGALAIIFVARTISRPIQRLTKQAEQISLGNLDQPVEIQGGGEIWQLGQAFQRMHASIKYLAEQIS